ncbi:flagellar biosynthesis protein FlhF [Anaerosolibacter sp.]|uniref:flagellar biosynthesis protein FlhF n=1 Tax=Anaerosolibacter sp. TaxID=1872527 RepID=UPI0039F0F0B7
MKVKRYIAGDAQEAMLKVKSELGNNAVILHSRKIRRPGLFGMFKKPLIEMVAAIEESNEKKVNSYSDQVPKTGKIHSTEANKIDEIQHQVGSIHNLLNNVLSRIDSIEPIQEGHGQKKDEIYEKYLNLLLQNDVEPSISEKILSIVRKQMSFTRENEEAIKNAIRIKIREYLGQPSPVEEGKTQQRTIVLIGPTGVGKTTTLAKLAAKLSINGMKSVGVITADTYRIAAVDQLRTYSEILGIPLKVVYEPQEMKDALSNFNNKDIVLIDTAGRNHKNSEQIEEVKRLIETVENPEIFLVISATTGYKDIKNIVSSYEFIKEYKLLFTKLDESSTKGNILNTKILTGKSLSYLTIGQSVPDDIEIANSDRIANSIVGEKYE